MRTDSISNTSSFSLTDDEVDNVENRCKQGQFISKESLKQRIHELEIEQFHLKQDNDQLRSETLKYQFLEFQYQQISNNELNQLNIELSYQIQVLQQQLQFKNSQINCLQTEVNNLQESQQFQPNISQNYSRQVQFKQKNTNHNLQKQDISRLIQEIDMEIQNQDDLQRVDRYSE